MAYTVHLQQVENELPEKIERLIRCDASAYQKLLMKRVEENLGSLGNPKVVLFAYSMLVIDFAGLVRGISSVRCNLV